MLKTEPDWNALPAEAPPPTRKLLRRCLEKDRKRRTADASDARLEIEEAPVRATEDAGPAVAKHRAASSGMAWIVFAGAVLALALLVVFMWFDRREASVPRQVRFPILIPENTRALSDPPLISPDGTKVAFILIQQTAAEPTLWIRDLE